MSDETTDDVPAQVIRDAEGKPLFAALPYAEFEALLMRARRASGLEAAADAIRAESSRLALIPSEVVHRVAQGENPVRVWRLHRGLKAVELAREAGISPGLLSEIESGKKDAPFRTVAQLAKTLDVKLDDLMPLVDELEIQEHGREVQLRDIARRISEIDSMINGSKGFDSGAVREAAQKLIAEATSFMSDRGGRFDWLEGIVEKAKKTIEEINSTEKSIVQTVTETQARLTEVFADSLARAGLFPREMLDRKPVAAAAAGNGSAAAPALSTPAPVNDGATATPTKPDLDIEDDDRPEELERPRGWFLR